MARASMDLISRSTMAWSLASLASTPAMRKAWARSFCTAQNCTRSRSFHISFNAARSASVSGRPAFSRRFTRSRNNRIRKDSSCCSKTACCTWSARRWASSARRTDSRVQPPATVAKRISAAKPSHARQDATGARAARHCRSAPLIAHLPAPSGVAV
ncbi:MAG: hypothetical protein GX547_03320 [Phycisphaerae bacterium]|nr:hypothetical protein [Phycisphaerae bacterium]